MFFGRWSITCLFCFWSIWIFVLATGTEKVVKRRTNIILLGATGDLSRKYLWQAIFSLYLDETTNDHSFGIFGAGRKPESKGRPIIDEYLKTRLSCSNHSDSECSEQKELFSKIIKYIQLKKDKDYDSLNPFIESSMSSEEQETGRIFYLSVPPFTYESIATNIHERSMPPSNAWLRVVLEKPFGHDLPSAIALSDGLSKYLKEKEMYRIDHYLGKVGVQFIPQFRLLNRDAYDPLWNNQHIDRIEIVMKETLDCAGRTKFYDNYGAIRDVLQNHLTEILVLVAMDLPEPDKNTPTAVAALKAKLLDQIKVPPYDQIVVRGQYSGYKEHVYSDTPKKSNTSVETFASVLLNVDNERWKGVPFLLSTGKKLDERRAYVRVLFKKRGVFCVESGVCKHGLAELLQKKEIIFNIQGGKVGVPAVSISSNLPTATMPSSTKNGQFIGYEEPAYTALLRAVFHGDLSQFVGTAGLLASWKIWDTVRNKAKVVAPCIYPAPTNGRLDVSIDNSGIHYIENISKQPEEDKNCANDNTFLEDTDDSKILGHSVFTGKPETVADRLSYDIHQAAKEAITLRGVFHLAVSGGRSPIKLFQALIALKDFPWEFVHVWLVDERCVPFNSDKSNYRMIFQELISHIPIIHTNIHPMHVHLKHGLCQDIDGATSYHAHLLSQISSLDFVVLGLGSDGHTASLFPGSDALQETSKLVIFSDAPIFTGAQRRMTLTYPALSAARQIAILVIGGSKVVILSQLLQSATSESSDQQYPVLRVLSNARKNTKQTLTWYIDEQAMPGTG